MLASIVQMIPVNEPLLNGNEAKYLAECIETGWISSEGPFVRRLEEGMAAIAGQRYAIAVMNSSVALDVAVAALRIGAGDEVHVEMTISGAMVFMLCMRHFQRKHRSPIQMMSVSKNWPS